MQIYKVFLYLNRINWHTESTVEGQHCKLLSQQTYNIKVLKKIFLIFYAFNIRVVD